MTREEAIHFAVCLKNNWTINFADMEEFCDMAIEALSEPSGAVTEVTDLINKDAISREGLLKSWEELSPRGRTEFDQVIMTIPALPSAEAEWISCSERLPKEKAIVLTYDSMGDIVFGQYDKGRWYWEAEACADYWAKNDGVIAWMPLPKPYREDGEI